eukprot:TRINITY_DN10165_c0_g1_i1.p1 TRINITY_DN10165_c0_g1~~TRINITY_DN10165_c0_g1_i1.p1  ORF type:complete len:183 (-),score=50.60 TRINITY_DN10165_c0_g1_i1:189-737(-)
MGDLDWAVINSRLPYKRTKEQYQMRKKMWGAIDVNDNGYVSLSEITRGVRDVLNLGDLFDCRPAINRAYHYSRSVSKSTKKHDDDYLEFREFRVFLQALRQFFEYYQAFNRLDSGQDGRVSKEEFLSDKIKESIEIWVGPIDDMEAEFAKIDKNGGGQILFSEFVDWALEKNLDIEDDIDED